uniref:Uncharacterized protein n=1 Tax=Pyxicephalus adspersus TaxID=30357 RepID=A0AAV2ZQX3_PYXAD|nr:TPA: hypothetical protein GDO54_003912 [Pyxicephalus adspersus]
MGAPVPCRGGSFSDAGSSVCQPCPAGHYCHEDRTSRERMMQLVCPAGRVCPKGMAVFPDEEISICPQGYYCPEGSSEAKTCPNGTYGHQPGLEGVEECLQCPEGKYCYQEGQRGIPGPTGPCPQGYHCPPGTGFSMSFPCQPGSYWNMTKMGLEIPTCLLCPEGFFCDLPSLLEPKLCPAGFHCRPGSSQPEPCPEGTYSPREGLSSETECWPCEPGRFCAGAGLLASTGQCQEGFYCPERSISPSPSGGVCPPGAYCPAGSGWPTLCPPGTYSNQTGLMQLSQCLTCPPGMFCDGQIGSTPTGYCTAGYYCTEGSTSPVQNVVPQGHFSLEGSFMPQPCLPGTFQPLHAQSSCMPCPPGNFCNSSSLSDIFTCPQGHYCPLGSILAVPCPQVRLGCQSLCRACPTGHTCVDGDIVKCPVGYYCPEDIDANPVPCPPGTFNPTLGVTRAEHCLQCLPGMFCRDWASSAVSGPCQAGFFCTAGEGGGCPRGHYCPVGSFHPYACPAGTYNNLTHQQDCLPCPAGYYCAENTSDYSGFQCPAGFYCPKGTKHGAQFPCPRGYYNPDPRTHSLDSCLPCTPGHYCGVEGLSTVSGECDPGWFCVSAAWTPQPFDLDNYTSANCLCPATSTGGKCLPGFYCPGGTAEPISCAPGLYCEEAGLAVPSGECAAGYFCINGATTPKPTDSIRGNICPPGTFCPNGSHHPQLCPAGTFSADYSLGNVSQCKPCPAGYYCQSPGITSPTGQCLEGYYCEHREVPVRDLTLFLCPEGYFCPAGTQFSTQYSCPPGTYGPRHGVSNVTECVLCPSGKYCRYPGQVEPTGNCSAGYWCKGGAVEECPRDGVTGELCPRGHYCSEGFFCPQGTGLNWTACPPGTYSSEPGLESVSDCRLCDGGKYCMFYNATSASGNCSAGYYCIVGSQIPNPEVELSGFAGPCPSGHYCTSGSIVPSPCPAGTFSSMTKLHSESECSPCPPGHFCDSPGLVIPTGQCYEGFYCVSSSTSSQPLIVGYTGGPCPPGHFCPAGSVFPQPCPAGTYSPIERQVMCTSCLEGFFCPRNTSSLEGKECPPGFFCPAGTLFSEQFPCPRGTYNPRKGSHLLEDCLPCDPGHYCDTPGQTHVTGTCSEGYYCTRSAKSPTPDQGILGDVCPLGHYCPSASASPLPCPAGSYSNTKGNVGPEACVLCEPEYLCPIGHYCPTGSPEPKICSAGHYQDKRECPLGYYCKQGTKYGHQNPCPAGTFSDNSGLISVEGCSPCPGGWYCARPGLSTPSGKCIPGHYCTLNARVPNPIDGESGALCPAGHFCPAGSQHPAPCPAGSFQPLTGMSSPDSCLACPPGKFCKGEALSSISGFYQDLEGESSCKICPTGFYCNTTELGGSVTPQPCPAGHFCPTGSDSEGIQKCPRGTYSPDKQLRAEAECKPCPVGFYCGEEGLLEPSGSCLPGYWCMVRAEISNPNDGVTGAMCPAGKFCVSGDISGDCLAGYFCDVQSYRPDQSICPPGFFCPEGTKSPVPCDSGTFAPLSGGKASTDCQPCPSGHFCNGLGIAMPSLCPAGYYCPPGASFITVYPCPPGTYGPKTGASSKSDCEPCPAGMFCSSEGLHRPTGYCHAGYYCSQGAVNPTPITPRVPFDINYPQNDICPAGYYCPNGTRAPVPCPPGSFSMAAGLSTQGECQPCPAGHYCAQAGLSDPSLAPPCSAGYVCKEGSSISCPSDEIHGYRCPAGFYCPSGSSLEIPCEPGTFSPMPGASTCLPCPAGSSCIHVSTVEPFSCPRGNYCPAMTAAPIPCPDGTFNPMEGALSLASCKRCPAGRYCRGEANWEPDGLCSAGYYCEGEAADIIPQKTIRFPLNGPCPPGHYCPEGTPSPKPCPLGTLKNSTGGFSMDSCVPCYAGHFCASVGLSSPTGLCAAGFYCPGNFTSTSPTPFLCPKGHFCPSGSSHPKPCPTGQFQPNTGSHFCTPCQPGFYCQEAVAGHPQRCPPHSYCPAGTLYPLPCPNGTFTPVDMSGLREKGECLPCPPGQYCRGGKLQGPCAAGHFCLSGSSEYTPYVQNFSRSILTECNWGQMCAGTCPPGFYCQEGTVLPTPCPANTLRSFPGARHRNDCLPCPVGHWCKEGSTVPAPCPAGHYCSARSWSNANNPAGPQECPIYTYRSLPGAGSVGDCQPCPPGYYCRIPGIISYEDFPCPPGHWCPGVSEPLTCPAGTFRTESGAAYIEDCQHCPEGHHCPDPAVTMAANIIGIPCRPGFECPPGSVKEVVCRAGAYCPSRTGIPPQCPGGFFCPEGSSIYNTSAQLCLFPYYCPPGSARMIPCAGGYRALPTSSLRDSEEASCKRCEAGTYRISNATDASCQPCPAGYHCPPGVESYESYPCLAGHYCPSSAKLPIPCPPGTYGSSTQGREATDCHPCPAGTYNHLPAQVSCFVCGSASYSKSGAQSCVCLGRNRAFQESDGSCICQAGFVFYDNRQKQRSDSSSDQDCQPQVEERCSGVEVRLAATRKCVSPEQYDCTPFCGPMGGELSPELGMCHCAQYVSAEELCDHFCLMKAPKISMSFGSNRQFLLQIDESEKRRSRKLEVLNVLGPDHIWSSERVRLVVFASNGIFGVIVSSAQTIEAFLTGDSWSMPTPRKSREREQIVTSMHSGSVPRIPNPILCVNEGDLVLFQLSIVPSERASSHYPIYQKDHLFNSNPHWDFGAFRRLDYLIRETNVNISRFAHVFRNPGTYVFQDNGVKDRSLFVTVKDRNVHCDPAASHIQPSSPYQLTKNAIVAQQKLNLAPNWGAILGVLLLLFIVMVVLLIITVLLRPSLHMPSPMKNWKPRWRSLGEPYIPPEYVLTRDSLQFYETVGCRGSGEVFDIGRKEITYGLDERNTIRVLEDFSVRTLFDKLEDQTLHLTSQLGRHRNETLSFYKAFIQRIQLLKDNLRRLISASPLTKTLEELKEALKAQAKEKEMKETVTLKTTGDLVPINISQLSPYQLVVYQFGSAILHFAWLSCSTNPPLLLAAQSIPKVRSSVQGREALRLDASYYDSENRVLYVPRTCMEHAGELAVCIIHAVAQIKAGQQQLPVDCDYLHWLNRAVIEICRAFFHYWSTGNMTLVDENVRHPEISPMVRDLLFLHKRPDYSHIPKRRELHNRLNTWKEISSTFRKKADCEKKQHTKDDLKRTILQEEVVDGLNEEFLQLVTQSLQNKNERKELTLLMECDKDPSMLARISEKTRMGAMLEIKRRYTEEKIRTAESDLLYLQPTNITSSPLPGSGEDYKPA